MIKTIIKNWLPRIHYWHARVLWVLFVVFALMVAYSARRDIRKSDPYVYDFSSQIEKARAQGDYHPFLIVRFRQDQAFVDALDLIKKSPYEKFWIECYTIDPTMNLNYFIYPKEVRMDVGVQFDLYCFLLHKINEPPIDQPPPAVWEKKILVRQTAEFVEP